MNMEFWADICTALALLTTALFEIGVCAIDVVTEQVGCVHPQHVAWRTFKCAAVTFLRGTCLKIQVGTRCILAIDLSSQCFQHPAFLFWWDFEIIAFSDRVSMCLGPHQRIANPYIQCAQNSLC
jgi:hypothetical protein